jgi:nucleotide-binding universal stress UspA family protein
MKILVATDGSRAGVAAVRFASKLAAHNRGSELVVLTVYASAGAAAARTNGSGKRQEAQRVLDDAARSLRRGSTPARFEVVRAQHADAVPEAISRQADRLRADMVVVGSEGRESLNEWVVGGTALRLIYVARRPVTVVRAPRRRRPR